MGNPLLDWEISIDNTEFFWSHGLISDEMLMLRKTVCSRPRDAIESLHNNLSKECTDVIHKQRAEIGSYTQYGDVTLPICTSRSLFGQTVYLRKFDTLDAEVSGTLSLSHLSKINDANVQMSGFFLAC